MFELGEDVVVVLSIPAESLVPGASAEFERIKVVDRAPSLHQKVEPRLGLRFQIEARLICPCK